MAKTNKKVDSVQPTSATVMSYPQPPLRKAEDYLKAYSGYVYTATSAIAQEVASIDINLFSLKFIGARGKEEPITEQIFIHETLSVLQYANPLMTFYDLVEATQVYLELVGEAFWVVLREGDGAGMPRELWPIRPDWVKIVPSKDDIIGSYVYSPGGTMTEKVHIPKENMIHFKYLHPLNPYRGKGSVQAAALPLDTHTFSQEWNRNFFFNSAMPGMVFLSDKKFSEPVVKRFMRQWQDAYGGRSKSHKAAFLGGGFKMQTTSGSPKDLDFAQQQKMMRDDILAVFKVPRTILGLTDDVNRANAEATTRAFMERVVTPRMLKFVGSLNEFYMPMFENTANLFLDFTDPSPEDVESKLKVYENARKYTWMTPNEIRTQENLPPVEGGDDLFVGTMGRMGATETPPMDENEPTEDPDEIVDDPKEEEEEDKNFLAKIFSSKKKKKLTKAQINRKLLQPKKIKHMVKIPTKKVEVLKREKFESDLSKDLTKLINQMVRNGGQVPVQTKTAKKPMNHDEIWTEEAKENYWLAFVEKATRKEVDFRRKIIPLFEEQGLVVINNLNEKVKGKKKAERKALLDDVLFNLKEWVDRWGIVVVPFVKELIIEKGAEVLEFLNQNQPFDSTSDNALRYLQSHSGKFVKEINQTTLDKLRKTLGDGFEKGEGIEKLRRRVKKVIREATSTRARAIARTEVIRASNFAIEESYLQSEVVGAKQWLSERDDRVCPWCQEMDGKVLGLNRRYFKKGDTFEVGGKTLEFKVEDIKRPPLHVQCRCTLIPILKGDEKAASLDVVEQRQEKLSEAQKEARAIIDKAVEEAHVIVEGAKTKAEKEMSQNSTKGLSLVENAEIEASKIVKDARDKADTIIVKAEEDGKKKQSAMLSNLKKLRNKARELIDGQEKTETSES